jgi:hypothetical protein
MSAPVGCSKDEDCSGDTRGCLVSSHVCVACTKNEHCGDGMVCDQTTFHCVQCNGPADCGPDAVCDRVQQRCFQCLGDTDCHDLEKSTCSRRRECVDCEDNLGCAAPTPVCNVDTCVECTSDTNCSGDKHRCTSDDHCVECLTRDGDCRVAGKPVCIVGERRCVQCIADRDCGDPGASHCNASNACAGCSDDSQCAHLPATPYCDEAAHRCVECDKRLGCDNNACVPSTHTCSNVPRRTLETCVSCESDEQCRSGFCIPMTFSGQKVGSFCLDPQEAVTTGDCHVYKPYSRTLIDQPTIDGDKVTVCAPPDRTTCNGVLDAANPGKTCSTTSQCGVGMGLIDSICITSLNRCSYVCTADYDCPLTLGTCGPGGQCAPGN